MPREVREWSEIKVIGELWQPGAQAAMRYTVSRHAINNLLQGAGKTRVAELTREEVDDWAATWFRRNAGDFSTITDYSVDFYHEGSQLILPWQKDGSRKDYADAMIGATL